MISFLCGLFHRVLLNFAVLHNDDKIILRVGNEVDVLYRIAIDEKQTGEHAFLNHNVFTRTVTDWEKAE